MQRPRNRRVVRGHRLAVFTNDIQPRHALRHAHRPHVGRVTQQAFGGGIHQGDFPGGIDDDDAVRHCRQDGMSRRVMTLSLPQRLPATMILFLQRAKRGPQMPRFRPKRGDFVL
ncbi:MAG: hypothetical protein BWY76_03355 [bacterium ADurb.Bin429]|nr:MAG: hypothetical protein BWY76_03355 [bacterium ADurb.Bin429]